MNENNNYNNQPLSTPPSPPEQESNSFPQSNETMQGYQHQSYQGQFPQQGFNGQPVPYPPMNQYGAPRKNKTAAGLLGIFLGGLGIHNFYLGHTGKAIAQLLISILSFGILAFVSCIWGLIEGILILTSQPGSTWNQDAQGIPLAD